MEIRYSVNPNDFKRYTTEEIRKEFLYPNLFVDDSVVSYYTHVDRMVTLGCKPVTRKISIDDKLDIWHNFGTHFFLERREIGIFNVGGKGTVEVDGTVYSLDYKDCLYIGMGAKEIYFASEEASSPAKFYMASSPAHKSYPTKLLKIQDANHRPVGDSKTCNKRVINQFIHPDVLETCQLSMGMTELAEGSNWNTMPCHTHERRMEVYFYFEVPEDQAIFHLMGQGDETRHLVLHNEDAVYSPSWSIHAAAGTTNYTFIWAMCGENQAFDDMDNIAIKDLK